MMLRKCGSLTGNGLLSFGSRVSLNDNYRAIVVGYLRFRMCNGMACKGKCRGYGVRGHNGSMYELGMKYCSDCEKFFFAKGMRCLCCGRQMRARLSVKERVEPNG
jgi:hypothetical protein